MRVLAVEYFHWAALTFFVSFLLQITAKTEEKLGRVRLAVRCCVGPESVKSETSLRVDLKGSFSRLGLLSRNSVTCSRGLQNVCGKNLGLKGCEVLQF